MNTWAQESLCRIIDHEYIMWLKKKKGLKNQIYSLCTQCAKILQDIRDELIEYLQPK